MEIALSQLTGVIYARNGNKKKDVTDKCVSAVTIRMLEGYENNIIIKSRKDGKEYELRLAEVNKDKT